MTIEEAIRQLKASAHDTTDEFTEDRCYDLLNESIQQIASMLIAGGYTPMVQEVVIRDGNFLPHNFMKTCGTYPIKITGGRIELLDGERLKLRYFAIPERLTKDDYELPFHHDAIDQVVVKAALILALNENEYDIQQDAALMTSLQQAIASGMGYGG